jgi:nucleotide-binding universal stress UspA family protein
MSDDGQYTRRRGTVAQPGRATWGNGKGVDVLSTPRRILVATDLEHSGDSTVAFASALATRFGAELHLLHARATLEDPQVDEEQRELLDGLVTAAGIGVPAVRRHLVRGMAIPEAIVSACAELGCDLVVVGTHGRRGIRHLLLGSVTEEVVRTAPVPVLAVRPDAPPAGFQCRRLLVPHDFSAHSTEAVHLAAAWARSLGAAVILLHVVEPLVFPQLYAVEPLPDDTLDRACERSEEELEALAADALDGVAVECAVSSGPAAETIVSEADARQADLVFMGSRGLSGLEHLLLGSVTEKVLRRGAVPLVVVRGGTHG